MRLIKSGQPPFILRLITPFFFRQSKRVKSSNKYVFIVSSGRTGTKFIADYFNHFDGVVAVHEPKPSRILRMWTTAKLEGKVNDADLSSVLYKKRERLSRTNVYIESNPYLSGFINSFDEVFESSTVIHIVRDPRDYVKSAVNHGNYGGIKNFFNRYVPYWYPDVAKIVGIKNKLNPTMRVACYWKVVNEFLSKEGLKSKNYHLLKFEDVFDDSGSGLRQLEKLIGIEDSSSRVSLDRINKSKHNAIESWQEWSPSECQQMDKIWQPLAKKYGYCQEKAWKDKISG